MPEDTPETPSRRKRWKWDKCSVQIFGEDSVANVILAFHLEYCVYYAVTVDNSEIKVSPWQSQLADLGFDGASNGEQRYASCGSNWEQDHGHRSRVSIGRLLTVAAGLGPVSSGVLCAACGAVRTNLSVHAHMLLPGLVG